MKNKYKALEMIIKNEKTTRNELLEELGISQAAVSKLVKGLMHEGYIVETASKQTNTLGRNSKYLQLNEKFGNIVGIYYGFSEVRVAVGDLKGNITEVEAFSLERMDNIMRSTFLVLDRIFKEKKPIGIGIAMNGIVNSEAGISIKATFYNWANMDLKQKIQERYGVPVSVENGANLIAIYEKEKGIAQNIKNFIVINVANGVGAALYLNNELHKGEHYDIGEIGHTPFDYSNNAKICSCGNKGCIETLLANWIVERRVFEKFRKKYSYSEIVELANKGDKKLKEIILESLIPLSHIIIWITSLLSFEKIIISGEITNCGSYYLEALKSQLRKNILNKEKTINIAMSEYKENKILEGAMLLAARDLFNRMLYGGEKSE